MKSIKVSKLLVLALLIAFIAVMAAGCGSTAGSKAGDSNVPAAGKTETSGASETSSEKTGYKIAFSNSYVGNSWRSESVKIFDAYAQQKKDAGIISEYYSSSSGNDPQAQINEIRNMMSQGYDAILINAASPTALIPVVEEAIERGIVIVSFDNTVDSEKAYSVNTDQVEFGRIQAEWLCKKLNGEGNILIINGVEGTTVSRDRDLGYKEILKNYPNIKVLQQGFGKWDEAATAVLLNNMLDAHKGKEINGILAEGGENAIFDTLVKHGLDPTKIPMSGDMSNGFFRHMKEDGVIGIAVGQPPYLSAAALDVAIRVLNGEDVEKVTMIPLPVGTSDDVDKWYAPGQPDNFFVDWTDNENTYNLTIEQILPKK